jgi:hypothetical protein
MPENIPPAPAQPEIPSLSSIHDFLFGAALYAQYALTKDTAYALFSHDPLVVDGHCPNCQKTATFYRSAGQIPVLELDYRLKSVLTFAISCTRNAEHKILFWLKLDNPYIQKIGQYPSLADIANDESRTYRQVLNRNDGAELHRAIGLAAHGVGVGSFVYLRRVFERMISQRFEDFKEKEGWSALDFVAMRMAEKIELLEHHLPDFLVRNKKVYAILSKGIHELQEPECLNAFEMLKHAIFFILDEDKHKKEELERRRKAEQAIAAFSADKVPPPDHPTTPK